MTYPKKSKFKQSRKPKHIMVPEPGEDAEDLTDDQKRKNRVMNRLKKKMEKIKNEGKGTNIK